MAISSKSIKLLWSNAAGFCSFPDCDKKLTSSNANEILPHTIGEMAHIKGDKPKSNRYDKNQTIAQRNDYQNLILLCPYHHTIIDKPENEKKYSVDLLQQYKKDHEAYISNRLCSEKIENLDQLKELISTYLADSKQAWIQYGPLSELAKKNPNSDQAYAIWQTARLTTIAPNNRQVAKVVEKNRKLFTRKDQNLISEYLQHVASYEDWINDLIPYQAVRKFPQEFENLILGE